MGINARATIAIAALSVVSAIAPANAATFTYEDSNPKNRDGLGLTHRAGKYSSITATFDDQTDVLNWSSTFTRNKGNNRLSDGAWLVLSDGENPKGDVDEYAIIGHSACWLTGQIIFLTRCAEAAKNLQPLRGQIRH